MQPSFNVAFFSPCLWIIRNGPKMSLPQRRVGKNQRPETKAKFFPLQTFSSACEQQSFISKPSPVAISLLKIKLEKWSYFSWK